MTFGKLGSLGRGFGRLGSGGGVPPSGGVPANALTTEDSDPFLTEDGDYIVTES